MIQPGCVSTKPVDEPVTSEATQPTWQPVSSAPVATTSVRATSSPPQASATRLRFPPTRPAGEPAVTSEDLPVIEGALPPSETIVIQENLPRSTLPTTYTVQRGDSVWALSRKFGVPVQELLDLNGLDKEAILSIGQTLKIPAGSTAVVLPALDDQANDFIPGSVGEEGLQYTIRNGDSLSKIAREHGTTVRTLKEINGLSDDRIYAGQQLLIPSSSGSESALPSEEPYSEGPVHVVKSGETPGLIAQRYGMSTEQLMALNGIDDPRLLQVGQRLKVSGAPVLEPSTSLTATGSSVSPKILPQEIRSEEVVIRDDSLLEDPTLADIPEAVNPFDAADEIPIIEMND